MIRTRAPFSSVSSLSSPSFLLWPAFSFLLSTLQERRLFATRVLLYPPTTSEPFMKLVPVGCIILEVPPITLQFFFFFFQQRSLPLIRINNCARLSITYFFRPFFSEIRRQIIAGSFILSPPLSEFRFVCLLVHTTPPPLHVLKHVLDFSHARWRFPFLPTQREKKKS